MNEIHREPAPPRSGFVRDPWILGALATALVLWFSGSLLRSLWGDEFLSLYHDRAPDLSTLFASLKTDIHPPLPYLFQRASIRAFGESELALRLPSLLAGAFFLLLLARVSTRLPDRSSRRLALWIAALSSFSFDIFTETRAYGFLALATLGVLDGGLKALEGKRGSVRVALWIAVGLHSHYYFFHYLLVLGIAALLAAGRWPELRRHVVHLALAALVGLAAFLPWGVTGFPAQIGQPGYGGPYHSVLHLLQSLGHLLFINASLGGRIMTNGIALPGVLIAGASGAIGIWRLLARNDTRRFVYFLLALGIAVPLWAFLVALVYERYNWRYISGSAAPIFMLVAAGISGSGAWRRGLQTCLLAALAAVTGANLLSGGREDYREAVAFVLSESRPGDCVLLGPLWDPHPGTSPTGWDYYVARQREGPATSFFLVELRISEFERAIEFDRIWMVNRNHDWIMHLLPQLSSLYESKQLWQMGPGLEVVLYSR